MKLLTEAHILVPTLLLIVASVMDVKTGKFPNWLFLTCLSAAAIWLGAEQGGSELMKGLGAAALAFIILTPLVFLKALGAGDIKLMAVFCLLTDLATTGSVFVYSLFWGLLFGLLKMALSGELKSFAQSFVLRNPQVKSQKIPYTVAILFGWFSFLSVGGLV
jgi:Flp pilus assembly protein protease CpaA